MDRSVTIPRPAAPRPVPGRGVPRQRAARVPWTAAGVPWAAAGVLWATRTGTSAVPSRDPYPRRWSREPAYHALLLASEYALALITPAGPRAGLDRAARPVPGHDLTRAAFGPHHSWRGPARCTTEGEVWA